MEINLKQLTISWTKYDIVQVMDSIDSLTKIESYKKREVVINEAILKSFLNIKDLKNTTPEYWIRIQDFPKQKKLFALLSILFTHIEVIDIFKNNPKSDFGGNFEVVSGNKMYTNIRSALVESGASVSSYRRSPIIPYDFSLLFEKGEVGLLFKDLLKDRIRTKLNITIDDTQLLKISKDHGFHEALSLTIEQFRDWTSGKPLLINNLNRHINKVKISKFISIEEAYIDFQSSKEIYFLGENGDGKSLFLMAIYLAFNYDYITTEINPVFTSDIQSLINNIEEYELMGIDSLGKEYGIGKKAALINLFAYGTHRGRYSSDDHEEYGFMSLFSTEEKLMSPELWLKDQALLAYTKNEDFIFSSFEVIEKTLSEILENNVKPELQGTNLIFKEKGKNLKFDQLSEGYRSVTIFVVDLLYRLTQITKSDEDIFRTPAIVIVDEIDSHLHPKWKLTLVQKLRKLFPNIQFIFTTHSPTIIQGASEDAIIYKVYRDSETGNTSITDEYFRKDMNHMMLNTLVTSSLFGLENARLSKHNEDPDTSNDDLTSRIHKIAKQRLEEKKAKGATFISEEEINKLIKSVFEDYD